MKKDNLSSLDKYKKSKLLDNNLMYKEQKWIPLSTAFNTAIGLPGIPQGHLTIFRGHSNTAKTTALIEVAIECQKQGILPVFIITEMKWSWDHAEEIGFKMDKKVDKKTGEVNYEGFFLYIDKSSLNSIEDVANFILDTLDEQKKGNLPYNLCFLWDSVGSIKCNMSLNSKSENAEWDAKAMTAHFSGYVNQEIVLSRKSTNPYTNSFVAINKIWVDKGENPYDPPVMKNKGGMAMFSDASLVVTFGNIKKAGTSKIKAVKNGKEIEFAVKTRISADKNHLTGFQTSGKVLATPHGFIADDKTEIESYKSKHMEKWSKYLDGADFDLKEEQIVSEEETKIE